MHLWDEVRTSGRNEKFRENYVRNYIRSLGDGHGQTFLDVGAGNMPYRKQINEAGFDYLGHDFGQYTGDSQYPGLQAGNGNWSTSGHDITCDIVDLPKSIADFIICTEVLEHVPDPLAALNSISKALKIGGGALITVPLQSRMHQAPYWFVSGLSPYWFYFHAPLIGLEVTKITKAGDFVDQTIQEFGQFASILKLGHATAFILRIIAPIMRKLCNKQLLESGGLGVYVHLRKQVNLGD